MPEDLPIYSGAMLRTSLQFAELERLKGRDTTAVWKKADNHIQQMEGAAHAAEARAAVTALSKQGLLQMHGILFRGRAGAGELRINPAKPLYRGHDCPDPQFIDRSLDNFFHWLTAESITEIHPIERAALVLTRVVDIWPFEFGNITLAIMSANLVLRDAGLSPFFVLPEHAKEFNIVLTQAMSIETQPLVNAIFGTIKREMQSLAS
jgi:Fic family protein